jgi:hypothetical protein
MKPCAYRVDGSSVCLRPSTHVCLVERIGEGWPGQQSGVEARCEGHADMADVIDAWTHEEMETMNKD